MFGVVVVVELDELFPDVVPAYTSVGFVISAAHVNIAANTNAVTLFPLFRLFIDLFSFILIIFYLNNLTVLDVKNSIGK